jgi:hypothetical protein
MKEHKKMTEEQIKASEKKVKEAMKEHQAKIDQLKEDSER